MHLSWCTLRLLNTFRPGSPSGFHPGYSPFAIFFVLHSCMYYTNKVFFISHGSLIATAKTLCTVPCPHKVAVIVGVETDWRYTCAVESWCEVHDGEHRVHSHVLGPLCYRWVQVVEYFLWTPTPRVRVVFRGDGLWLHGSLEFRRWRKGRLTFCPRENSNASKYLKIQSLFSLEQVGWWTYIRRGSGAWREWPRADIGRCSSLGNSRVSRKWN